VTRLQLNRVYTSYWFVINVVLIAVSLSCSIYVQTKRNLRSFLLFRKHEEIQSAHNIIFSKTSFRKWGSVIFHSGLLLVIISALLIVCFQKRGFVQLIEGESFDGKENNLLVSEKGILANEFNIGYETSLSKLRHEYWPSNKVKFLESNLYIAKKNEIQHKVLSVNHPVLVNDIKIYQSLDYGYTLSFRLERTNGEEIISNFNIDRASDVDKLATGTSDFPQSPYIFRMKFIPDLDKKTYYLNKPIVYLTISEGLNTLFSGLVVPGSSIKLNDGILHFAGVRYWSGLIYVKNRGMSLAYIGFAITILGSAIMFILPCKEIYANHPAADQSCHITNTSQRDHGIYKEEVREITEDSIVNG